MGTTLIKHYSNVKTGHIFSLIQNLFAVLGLVPVLLIRCVFQDGENEESNCRNYRVLSHPYNYFKTAAKVSTEIRVLLCLVELLRKVPF